MNPTPVTPYQQLLPLLATSQQHQALSTLADILQPQYFDDLCLAIIAYIRFGIRRPFHNKAMYAILDAFIQSFTSNK